MSEEEQKHLQQSYYDLHEKYYKQKEEIERLTELCNKYEEEHKTTFETWQKDIKENEQLHSIIKEVRELRKQLSYQYYENGFEYDTPMLLKDLDKILDKVEENK